MGYGITPFRVNISRVEACFGMKDLQLRDKILASCEVRIEKLDEWFDDGTPFEVILRDFLAGDVTYPGEGHKYPWTMALGIPLRLIAFGKW
jgi:predicted component of type VI protein secretion system